MNCELSMHHILQPTCPYHAGLLKKCPAATKQVGRADTKSSQRGSESSSKTAETTKTAESAETSEGSTRQNSPGYPSRHSRDRPHSQVSYSTFAHLDSQKFQTVAILRQKISTSPTTPQPPHHPPLGSAPRPFLSVPFLLAFSLQTSCVNLMQ